MPQPSYFKLSKLGVWSARPDSEGRTKEIEQDHFGVELSSSVVGISVMSKSFIKYHIDSEASATFNTNTHTHTYTLMITQARAHAHTNTHKNTQKHTQKHTQNTKHTKQKTK